jgi:hypothetical protein
MMHIHAFGKAAEDGTLGEYRADGDNDEFVKVRLPL